MTLEQRISKLERQIGEMKHQTKWVRASVIMELTNWNGERMRQARENGEIRFKKNKAGSYDYDLNSLHPLLLKKAS